MKKKKSTHDHMTQNNVFFLATLAVIMVATVVIRENVVAASVL
jgi:hypothetical protein